MATARRHTTRRRQYDTDRREQMYVYGNAVPKEVEPRRAPKRKPNSRTVRQKTRRSRNQAAVISSAYMLFLAAAAAVAVVICVGYLCLQADIVNRAEHIAQLQEQLSELNEQNTTAYNAAEATVNLETVWERATGEMGMVYVANGQVVEYESPEEDSVVQYGDIPVDGILAKGNTW